jgi:hypothetical protein
MEATAVTRDPLPRAENLPAGYSPGWHIARTLALASGILVVGLGLARHATVSDLLFAPLFIVAFNTIEWLVHRGPMHHPRPPRIMYRNHTLIHHRAFLHDQMAIEHPRELGLIMMPWYTMLGLFVVATPIALLASLVRGPGVAGVFYVCAVGYFLAYETQHALYHLPPATLRRLGLGGRLFRWMQAHHSHHHRLERMTFVNFNVTFPLMDLLLRTRERPEPPEDPGALDPNGDADRQAFDRTTR